MNRILIYFFLILFFNLQSCERADKDKLDWLFIYYMPYDNNLSSAGTEIIEMLQSGTTQKIGATIGADFQGDSGFQFISLSDKKMTIEDIPDLEESADGKTLALYLNWVQEHFDFKHYAIIFLNHGGRLDETGLDEYPTQGYMKLGDMATQLKRFIAARNQKPELLFFQVCSKGSIESLFELRDCSRYTLFSQYLLGAPNYYYQPVLELLAERPDISGSELALLIAKHDKETMFSSYSCVNNSKMENFVHTFNRYLKKHHGNTHSKIKDVADIVQYEYANENYFDFKSFLDAQKTPANYKDNAALIHFMEEDLLEFNYINPQKDSFQLSGLSLFSPFQKNFVNYTHLEFYKSVDMIY